MEKDRHLGAKLTLLRLYRLTSIAGFKALFFLSFLFSPSHSPVNHPISKAPVSQTQPPYVTHSNFISVSVPSFHISPFILHLPCPFPHLVYSILLSPTLPLLLLPPQNHPFQQLLHTKTLKLSPKSSLTLYVPLG